MIIDFASYIIGSPWNLPPALVFYVGAAFLLFSKYLPAPLILIATPTVGLINLITMENSARLNTELLSYSVELIYIDELSFLFGILFHIAALFSAIYALKITDTRQHVSAFIYVGSALGAVFSADLLSLFIFWELLAISSAYLIWVQGTRKANQAALRYLFVHVISGLILLAGAILHIHKTGSIGFIDIDLTGTAKWLILLAFGIKCGFPILHSWLPDSYPQASPTGTVFLSAFTTKVAIYVLARAFVGTEVLIYIGAAMTMFPIFYAVIENDLRRVLAYSMINQLGFMVVGIGLGTAMAMNGAISHAFNDVVFKGLLFMSMGAVLHTTGRINGSDLGGLYRKMPMTTSLCIIGAASISAFPLFSGFVSKSMILTAALDEGYVAIWFLLLFASAGVFHHAGIKIPYFAFFAHDAGLDAKDPSWNMLLAMTFAAVICIVNGCYPYLLYSLLPYPVDYRPYEWSHVVSQLQLLLFSALAFAWLIRSGTYPPELRSVNLDVDWIYRRGIKSFGSNALLVFDRTTRHLMFIFRIVADHRLNPLVHHLKQHGVFARTWSISFTVLCIITLLLAYLVHFFLYT